MFERMKNFSLFAICVAVVIIFAPAAVFGAGGGDGGHADISSLMFPVVNFVLYVLLFTWAYRKLARPALRDRSVRFKERLGKTVEQLRAAENELARQRERLANIGQEQSALIDRLEREGTNIAVQMEKDAETRAQRRRQTP